MKNKIVRQGETTKGKAIIDGQPHQIIIVQPPPTSNKITQLPDERPAQYTTAKSRGIPDQPLPRLRLPVNMLSVTLSAVVALFLLVSASLFSIALTSYSNSVDRVDRQRRQPTHHKF